jgi:hypothetical protein
MKSQVISQQPALAYMRLVVSPVRYTMAGLLLGFMLLLSLVELWMPAALGDFLERGRGGDCALDAVRDGLAEYAGDAGVARMSSRELDVAEHGPGFLWRELEDDRLLCVDQCGELGPELLEEWIAAGTH